MRAFNDNIAEYRAQLEKGAVKEAYRGLMQYFDGLRLHLEQKYPDYFVSSQVHYVFMDYTYFYFFPKQLKQRKLKIALFFVHETFTVQAWLAGYNKTVQAKYWKLFKKTNWKGYRLPATTEGVDSILEYTLVDNADFSDLDALTAQIEKGLLKFIDDIEGFLSRADCL